MTGFLVAAALTGWAAIGFAGSGEPREVLRVGLSLGLCAAFAYFVWTLRPRAEWGVKVTALSVLVSRPRGGLLELPWSEIREVRRHGEKRDTLSLWLAEDRRVLIPAHLFARRSHFDALAKAIDERMPEQRTGRSTVH